MIYLDPPYNSGRDYGAFDDRWKWDKKAEEGYNRRDGTRAQKVIEGLHYILGETGTLSYLIYLAERLEVLHRTLKPTGSLYLHTDPTASHYLRILLDSIFGSKQFRNEIVWCYESEGIGDRHFAKKHDTILWYSTTEDYTFNIIRTPHNPESVYLKRGTEKNGKRYWGHSEGKHLADYWHIPVINSMAKERTGYPTQKPLALLERIIKASSNEGDTVLDPFCGSGTTLVAAKTLNRNYIGIDTNPEAIELTEKRLKSTYTQLSLTGDK